MTRISLLTEIPAPYRVPLFNALADRVDLTVLFLRARNPERPYRLHAAEFRFEWRILRGIDATIGGRWLVANLGVMRALRRARPDVVLLGGWNQPAFWVALAWARTRRLPAVVWVESTGRDRRSGRLEPTKRALLRAADAFLVPGRAAREYLLALGVADDRIAVAPNAVDPGLFGAELERVERQRPVVLAVGRLSPEKGLDVLLQAADGLAGDIVLAGTGPEENRLRRLAGEHVRFLGNVERDDLPALYAAADVFVLPSRSDPWGMALNEAAHAGLPLVATDAAGATSDLVEEGANGFSVPADDVPALRKALERLLGDPELRAAMGARSLELAAGFTPTAWAEAIEGLVARLARR
ncbi:MAG: glycosyltransferase family 4 protein [Gaiellaceae bacterium]